MNFLEHPRGEDCLSDLTFDMWRAGELSPERQREVETHLESCATCKQHHERLEQEHQAAAQYLSRRAATRAPLVLRPPASTQTAGAGTASVNDTAGLSETAPLSKARSHRVTPRVWWSGALAVAAALVLFIATPPSTHDTNTPATRSKGTPRLSFALKRGNQVTTGLPGQVVHPGDQLRFIINSPSQSHVAILSRDGAGQVSVYYPPSGNTSLTLESKRDLALAGAIELDAVLGREHLYGVFCDAPFDVEPLRQELATTFRLVAPAGCTLDELVIDKVKP